MDAGSRIGFHTRSTSDPWTVGSIETERVDGTPDGAVTVVRLVGEHDLTTVAALRAALTDVDDGDGLVIDLARCEFVDSSVIGTLLHARRDRPAFAVVLPANPEAVVTRALHVIGVVTLLGCCASLEAARRVVAALEPAASSPGAGRAERAS